MHRRLHVVFAQVPSTEQRATSTKRTAQSSHSRSAVTLRLSSGQRTAAVTSRDEAGPHGSAPTPSTMIVASTPRPSTVASVALSLTMSHPRAVEDCTLSATPTPHLFDQLRAGSGRD